QQLVAYTRAPDGTIALASAFNAMTQLEALSDDGAIIYLVNGNRYLGRAGVVPSQITTLGRPVFRDAQWYIVLGASLFQVNASAGPLPDGGIDDGGSANDGSVSDAGGVDSGASDGSATDATIDGAPGDASAGDTGASDADADGASSSDADV